MLLNVNRNELKRKEQPKSLLITCWCVCCRLSMVNRCQHEDHIYSLKRKKKFLITPRIQYFISREKKKTVLWDDHKTVLKIFTWKRGYSSTRLTPSIRKLPNLTLHTFKIQSFVTIREIDSEIFLLYNGNTNGLAIKKNTNKVEQKQESHFLIRPLSSQYRLVEVVPRRALQCKM